MGGCGGGCFSVQEGLSQLCLFWPPPSHAPQKPTLLVFVPLRQSKLLNLYASSERSRGGGVGGLEPSRTGNGSDRGKVGDKEVTVGGWVVGSDSLKTQLNDVESEGKHAVRS